METLASELAREFRVITLDWPGHGESAMPSPPASLGVARISDALEDVVAALRVGPATFLGNSVGATASVRLAVRMPEQVRALVLVDSGGFVSLSPMVRAFCWVQGRAFVRRRFGMAFARNYFKVRNAHVDAALSRMAVTHRDKAFIEATAALWRSFGTAENDLVEAARTIRAPAMIAWGRRDPVIRAKVEGKLARATLPHARYVEFDTGHIPFLEEPEAFLEAVLPFLRAHAGHSAAVDAHA